MRPLGANPSLTAPQAGPVATQPCQSCQAPTAVPTSAGTGTPVRIQSTAGGAELTGHQVPDDAFRHHRAETSPRCDQISKGCSPGKTTEVLITGSRDTRVPSTRASGPSAMLQGRSPHNNPEGFSRFSPSFNFPLRPLARCELVFEEVVFILQVRIGVNVPSVTP